MTDAHSKIDVRRLKVGDLVTNTSVRQFEKIHGYWKSSPNALRRMPVASLCVEQNASIVVT